MVFAPVVIFYLQETYFTITGDIFYLQETYFTVIVQKNPLYQTGEDLQESLLCIYDLGDITVGNNVNTGYSMLLCLFFFFSF